MKKISVVLSFLIVFELVFSPFNFVTVKADASDDIPVWDGSVDVSWFDPDTIDEKTGLDTVREYEIDTPQKLAGLAAVVNGTLSFDCTAITYPKKYTDKIDSGQMSEEEVYNLFFKHIKADDYALTGSQGGNEKSTVYLGSWDRDFYGVIFHITSDMDMGGKLKNGSWSGYNWTPIGGKFPQDTRSYKSIKKGDKSEYGLDSSFDTDCQTIDAVFNGIIDGGNHTLYNFYCDRYTDKGFPYCMGVGLVGQIAGTYDEKYQNENSMGYKSRKDENENTIEGWKAGIENLVIDDGYVSGRRMTAAIAGNIDNLECGAFIANCANRADVVSTDSRGTAGIAGRCEGSGTGCIIVNCYNTGNITNTYATSTGGIIGENGGASIYNCYNSGICTNKTDADYAMGIGGHDAGSYEVKNCYYLKDCARGGSTGDILSSYPGYFKGLPESSSISVEVTEISSENDSTLSRGLNVNGHGSAFNSDDRKINGGYPVLFFESSDYIDNKEDYGTLNVEVSECENGKLFAGYNGKKYENESFEVPFGQVIFLDSDENSGYILEKYNLEYEDENEEITSSFITVTEDSKISAVFDILKKGKIHFSSYDDFTIAAKITDEDERKNLSDGSEICEKSTLKVCAYINEGAEPSDSDKEYTGDFTYSYIYGSGKTGSLSSGSHKVTSDISSDITIKAEAKLQDKRWTTLKNTNWYDKNTYEDTFYISSPEELAGLSYLVNSRNVTFKGKTIKLTSDISLLNNDGTDAVRYWIPIGLSGSFEGTFDGCGKSITYMTVNTGANAGLFGNCNGAVIKNVSVYGSSQSTSNAAGIVSVAKDCSISNCHNHAVIKSTDEKAGAAGGICAVISLGTVIKNCINYESVTGYIGVGGITGFSKSGEDKDNIKECINYGAVNGKNQVGGIIGDSCGNQNSCANYGDVQGRENVGGLSGYTQSTSSPKHNYCINYGNVKASYNTAGGLIGYAKYVNIYDCFNAGSVSSSGSKSDYKYGPIIGRTYNASIYSSVKYAYYSKDKCKSGSDNIKNVNPIAVTDAKMKKSDKSFTTLLNKYGKGKFTYVKNDYPVISCFANLNSKGKAFSGPEEISDIKKITFSDIEGTRSLTFDEFQNLESMPCVRYSSQSGINSGKWNKTFENWDGTENLRVSAVYDKNYVSGNNTELKSGKYFLNPMALGKIIIKENQNVILDGEGAKLSDVEIVVNKGAELTLKNVEITNDVTVLTLNDAKLLISGDVGIFEESRKSGTDVNENPAIKINGECEIKDADEKTSGNLLEVESSLGNCNMLICENSTLNYNLEKMTMYDGDRLGGELLGIITGLKGSRINVTGGTLAIASDSSGIYAVKVGTLNITGGNVYANVNSAGWKKENSNYGKAVYVEDSINIENASVNITAHLNKADSTDPDVYIYGEDAVEFGDNADETFIKNHHFFKAELGYKASYHTISIDGNENFNIIGENISFDAESEGFEDTGKYVAYLWLENGKGHDVVVDGENITSLSKGDVKASLLKVSYVYDGKLKKPGVKSITIGEITPKYSISYDKNCSRVGKHKVTLTGKGDFTGKKVLYYTVKPKGTSISKISKGKKKFTVKWKVNKNETSGYQLEYSLYSSFKNSKTITLGSNKKSSYTAGKLKKGKKYYVRIRTYKSVSGTKYYSSWSSIKSVKIN